MGLMAHLLQYEDVHNDFKKQFGDAIASEVTNRDTLSVILVSFEQSGALLR